MHKRIIKELEKNPSLWKAIRLRFLTICAAFSVMWAITGSPVTSVGLTAAQQSVSFGVHYLFEENEKNNLTKFELSKIKRKIDAQRMPEEWKKHGVDAFLPKDS